MNHDLVKRLLWPARDRRDLGGAAAPGELVVRFVDEEGAAIAGAALWQRLCDDAPSAIAPAALEAFGRALDGALAASAAGDVAGVLALETAFADLARIVKAVEER